VRFAVDRAYAGIGGGHDQLLNPACLLHWAIAERFDQQVTGRQLGAPGKQNPDLQTLLHGASITLAGPSQSIHHNQGWAHTSHRRLVNDQGKTV
jgi:hypothetical protein